MKRTPDSESAYFYGYWATGIRTFEIGSSKWTSKALTKKKYKSNEMSGMNKAQEQRVAEGWARKECPRPIQKMCFGSSSDQVIRRCCWGLGLGKCVKDMKRLHDSFLYPARLHFLGFLGCDKKRWNPSSNVRKARCCLFTKKNEHGRFVFFQIASIGLSVDRKQFIALQLLSRVHVPGMPCLQFLAFHLQVIYEVICHNNNHT